MSGTLATKFKFLYRYRNFSSELSESKKFYNIEFNFDSTCEFLRKRVRWFLQDDDVSPRVYIAIHINQNCHDTSAKKLGQPTLEFFLIIFIYTTATII